MNHHETSGQQLAAVVEASLYGAALLYQLKIKVNLAQNDLRDIIQLLESKPRDAARRSHLRKLLRDD